MIKTVDNVNVLLTLLYVVTSEFGIAKLPQQEFVDARAFAENSKPCYKGVFISTQSFEEICKAAQEKLVELNEKKSVFLKYHNGYVEITNDYLPQNDKQHMYYIDMINILTDYCRKSSYVRGAFNNLSKFDLSLANEEQIKTAKLISSYIVDRLLSKYLEREVQAGRYPCQCKDVEKYIFNNDLCKIINLECTKKELISMYRNGVRIIAQLLVQERAFAIGESNKLPLAYSNYCRIVRPFKCGNDYGKQFNVMVIRVSENGKIKGLPKRYKTPQYFETVSL